MDENKYLQEQAVKKLKKIQEHSDTEGGHIEADDVLCDLLKELGYDEVVDEFEKVHKWYA